MTENNAAPAHLTDAEIQDIADGFDIYGAKPEFARAIESALLSKLRAPVADDWKHELLEAADRQIERINAALASAPVAGEAIAGYMVGSDYFRPDVLAAAQIYAENRNLPVRTLRYADAAPKDSEAVRILFPTHLRKMWSGGEVQAWLDEHQGVTAPKPSAKGSLQRYREWQANQDSGVADLRQAFNTFGSKVFKALAAIARVDGPDTRKEDDPELIYREPVMDEAVRIRQAYDELSAALSAQPGAQKEQ